MPLLNKQKFNREPIPDDLDPEQDIFYSKLTQEIFLDYEKYFERTILCNSLVWTCSLTGKTGLTFSEALESEQKARKTLSNFPIALEKPIIYLLSLTKRGNIKDLIEDVFSFTKDRFFLDENVILISNQSSASKDKTTSKIIDIILPNTTTTKKENITKIEKEHDDETVDVEMDFEQEKSQEKQEKQNGLLIDASKIKYIIETYSTMSPQAHRQTVKSNQIQRTKNLLTKDKIYMIVKNNCETNEQSIWQLTEKSRAKFDIDNLKYSDMFRGDPPQFEYSFGRGQFSKSKTSGSPKQQQLTFDKSNGKLVSKSNNESPNKSIKTKANNSKTMSKSGSKSKLNDSTSLNQKTITSHLKNTKNTNNNKSLNESPKKAYQETAEDLHAQKIVRIMCKKIIEMDDDEYFIWKYYVADEDMKELNQINQEFEKVLRKEEKEKEKEKLKTEKQKQKELLKELKNPKDDCELENLVDLPQAQPIKSKITQEMFGDAVMILEFLNLFGDLFELKDDFPNGFNYDLLENALFSKSCDSALCNLLLFYLDSIFKCYDEETFDEGGDSDNESTDDLETDDLNNKDSDEYCGLDQLYHEPIKSTIDRDELINQAETYAKLIKSVQGRSMKNIGLDVYTISEMLRLYFITSGCSHHSKTKFWYQQRGGYTNMDECGIDFALNEKNIIKKLEYMNVYELEPNEKLKILACLCHQLMTQVRFRDLLEDNWQKMSQCKAQLRDLQTEENRRLREEASERWKKKMAEKQQNNKGRVDELKSNGTTSERGSLASNDSNSLFENNKQLIESNKKRQEFLRKEKLLQEEINQLQMKCCMTQIGKDRFYRRYWIFKSLPGIFVEEEDECSDVLTNDISHSCNGDAEMKEEHENNKEYIKSEALNENHQDQKMDLDFKENLNNDDTGKQSTNMNNHISKSYPSSKPKWYFYYTSDSLEQLINSLCERGLRESELRQNILDFKEKIVDQLSKSYQQSIIRNLTMSQEDIENGLKSCLKENVSNVLANNSMYNINNTGNKTKRQAAKLAANQVIQILNSNPEISSWEFMEMDLRDKLLDIEEQVFVGALGSIKVQDRLKWKEALENNSYDPQCVNLIWAGGECQMSMIKQNDEFKNQIETKRVRDLAKALLQVEQSVEKRFLRQPLSDCLKTPDAKKSKPKSNHHDNHNGENGHTDHANQTLYSWEKSLMSCTTLSQIFIHLQTLDESIAWSKSALNARCRLCKRKGDAEKMLLCDKCDRGHHIYCLRPALKSIPEGDWFCSDCKPKDVEKTPRKIRKSFGNEDVYSEENEDENNDDSEIEEVDNDGEEDEESSSNETENEEDVENEEDEDEDDEENNEDEEEEDEEQEIDDSQNNNSNSNIDTEDCSNHTANTRRRNLIKLPSKNKSNTNNKKNSSHSDEDNITVNMSSDDTTNETNSKRSSTRKRKATIEEEKANTDYRKSTRSTSNLKDTSNSSSTKENTKSSTSSSTRSTRNKAKVADYNELSDEISGTDDDTSYHRTSKRNRTSTTASKSNNNSVLNDFHNTSSNTSTRNAEMTQKFKQVEKLLSELIRHEDAEPFMKPVRKKDAPDYYQIIANPMDFSKIKDNINNAKYSDYTKLMEDIRLIFENCFAYNEDDSDIHRTGQRLKTYFEKQAKKYGILDSIKH